MSKYAAAPWFQPPPGLSPAVVRRKAFGRFDWEKYVLGNRPKERAGEAWIPHTLVLTVALAAATYANRDGTKIHPGTRRLARNCRTHERTAQHAVEWLSDHGFLAMVAPHRGPGRGQLAVAGAAAEYRLTLPAPLLLSIDLWPPEEPAWSLEPEVPSPIEQKTEPTAA